tara:strand:+ start:1477 stop:2781 length:1305 start_codon:yes stop_codon:yes gene_type:complete
VFPNLNHPMKIAIIGTGLTGLSAAYNLSKSGHNVTLFDGASNIGGLASGFKEHSWDWYLERFYHHWFASDQHVLDLAKELNCEEKIIFNRPSTMMYYHDQFYPLDSPLTALKFPGLGWGINKVRFGLTTAYLKSTKNWRNLENVSAANWMKTWAGLEVYQTMWEPLLKAKFGKHFNSIPMSWLWARIHSRTTQLGTFHGGFQMFLNLLANRVKQQGATIKMNEKIKNITVSPDSQLTLYTNVSKTTFDKCIATCSPKQLLQIAPPFSTNYSDRLHNQKSLGAIVAILSLKHPLTKHYWFNLPSTANFPFLALVEHTNFVSKSHFNNEHIIYCGEYLETDHINFTISDEELLNKYLPALNRFNKNFSKQWINKSWVFRTPYAQPIPSMQSSHNTIDLQTPIENLFLASMSQIYPWDRGTNFAIELGQKAASIILE